MLYHFSKMTVDVWRKLSCSNAGQDAPPTEKENDIIKTTFAPILSKIVLISDCVMCDPAPTPVCFQRDSAEFIRTEHLTPEIPVTP